MKPLFYGLTIAAVLAGCYFSWNLKTNFEDQRAKKIKTLADHQKKVKDSDDELKLLNKEKDTLAGAKEQKATLEANIDQLTATANQLKKDIANLDGKLEEQKAKFAELARVQAQIAEILKSIPGGSEVSLENIGDKIKDIETNVDGKNKELAELKTNIEGAEKNVSDNQAEIARLGDREAERAKRFRQNSMESVVTAVNSDWGFIVIGAGANTGFTPQTKLLIERDGRRIAEVKPSAIEASQTIAEIEEESIAPGARIQPGDRVILSEAATN